MKFWVKLVIALLAILVLLLFTLQHPRDTVSLDLFGYPDPSYKMPVPLFTFAIFVFGLVVGIIIKGGSKKGGSSGGSEKKGK
jgi:uncharacterized integral membrane protein